MDTHHKINYIELPAGDFTLIKSFYQSVFDWSFTDYGNDYCAFFDGVMNGGFYRSEKISSAEQGAALVVLYSQYLETTQSQIQVAGGDIIKPIFSFPGGRRFHFTDPHGNELAVWSDR